MNDEEVVQLAEAVKTGNVIWFPDSDKCKHASRMSTSEQDEPCVVFTDGTHADLWFANRGDFYSISPVFERLKNGK